MDVVRHRCKCQDANLMRPGLGAHDSEKCQIIAHAVKQNFSVKRALIAVIQNPSVEYTVLALHISSWKQTVASRLQISDYFCYNARILVRKMQLADFMDFM